MAKRRANMSIEGDVLDVAKEYRLNVSKISEEALREAGRHAQAESWKRENAAVRARHVERLKKRGTRLGDLAAFRLSDEDG